MPSSCPRIFFLLMVVFFVSRRDVLAPAHPKQSELKVESVLSAQEALLEMLGKDYYMMRFDSQEIAGDSLLRDYVTRLVGFLRHPDRRVRRAAFDLLNAIQRDGPGPVEAPESWEEWLRRVKKPLNVRDSKWRAEGFRPIEDVLLDILEIRTQYPSQPKEWFLRDQAGHDALNRLVGYLRHWDRRVRVTAISTLTSLQFDRPGGADEPELWERWLKDLKSRGAPPPIGTRTKSTESVEDALLKMLSIPHRSTWGHSRNSELMKWPGPRGNLKQLVGFLRHSDKRVRQAAFNLLTSLQPERPGSVDDPEAWEAWLKFLEQAYPLQEPKSVKEDANPVEEVLSDIIQIRTHVRPILTTELVRHPSGHEALRHLISYLSHPDSGARAAAYKTLNDIIVNPRGDAKPGRIDREAWKRWLENLEKSL